MVPPGGDGHRPRVAARLDRARDAVPDDARPQLGELVGGVVRRRACRGPPRSVAPELGVVLGPPHEARTARRRGQARSARRGHDLLGEHVERVARARASVSMAPSCIAPGHDGALEQVAAVLREDDAARRLADLVAGPADPLEPAARPTPGDSTWMTRSTAPMSMPSSSELVATMRRQPALLERVLDLERAARGRASRGARGRAPRRPAR